MCDLKEGAHEKEVQEDGEVDESRPILSNRDSAQDLTSRVKTKSIWNDTNWRQKTIIVYVSIVNFLNFLCNSTATPFLARTVLQKGGTVVLSSVVLQVSMLMMAIFSLVIAKYQVRIGCKNLIISGQILFAFSQIAFGAIGYFDSVWALVAVGAILRAIQGVCQAALVVGGLTVVCQEFPNHLSFVFGIIEAAYGAGALIGPYLGGSLYDESGGMMMPLAVSGTVTLLFSVMGMVVLRKTYECTEYSTDRYIAEILKNPKAVVVIGFAGTIAGAFTLFDATVTVYLKTKAFSVTNVGQLNGVMGLSYCVLSPLTGWAVNTRKIIRLWVMVVGLLGGLVVPLAFTPDQTSAWIFVTGFGFAGFVAVAFIPAFDEFLCVVDVEGKGTGDVAFNSAVSGLWGTAIALSNFVVPLVGSSLQLVLPFSYSLSGSLLAGYSVTLIFSWIILLYQNCIIKKLSV